MSIAFLACCLNLAGQDPVPADSMAVNSMQPETELDYGLPDTGRLLPGMTPGRVPALPSGNGLFDDGFPARPSLLRPEMPYRAIPEITVADLKIYNPYVGLDPAFLRSANFVLMPIGMHYLNPVEGGNMAGVGGAFRISDNITANVSSFVSSAYSGFSQSDRMLNASLNLSLDIRLAERLTLRTFGQYSVAPGLNPALNPMIGTGNYFGGALRVMITDNFGLEGGFTRSYFMGEWHNSYYVIPVINGIGAIGISIGGSDMFPVTQREMMKRNGTPMK